MSVPVLDCWQGKRILVVGDIMLDHYISGTVDRISPEAPVPVVEVKGEEYRLGGAANVALNLKVLGAIPVLLGVSGMDAAGARLNLALNQFDISTEAIFTDANRVTTQKTRVSAVGQQIVRLDYENLIEISQELENRIIEWLNIKLVSFDAVIVEDYNKGLLSLKLIQNIIDMAKQAGKIISVDPKQRHFFDYVGVDVFKPNYSEMQKNLGVNFDTEDEFFCSAAKLQERINAAVLIVTRGSKGLYIFTDHNPPIHIPTFAKEVYDVSGAGDTVISVLTLAYASGFSIVESATIANHAAGVVCGKRGTATATVSEIYQSYHDQR
jgi:rfaE bifunctional protein kinase chain/domain